MFPAAKISNYFVTAKQFWVLFAKAPIFRPAAATCPARHRQKKFQQHPSSHPSLRKPLTINRLQRSERCDGLL